MSERTSKSPRSPPVPSPRYIIWHKSWISSARSTGHWRTRTGGCRNAMASAWESPLLAGMISRACAPRSKRAFAAWAEATALPELMGFAAKDLDSQHFWDQMHALPVKLLGDIEQAMVREVIGIEQLQPRALAYDTTNFY